MLVLFDIDDTLLDDRRATRVAAAKLHAVLQSEVAPAEFSARWDELSQRHFARYLAGEVSFQEQRRARVRDAAASELPDARADQLFAAYLSEYERAWCLFPDVLPCFAELGDHRLGVVSNGSAAQQREKLSRLGLLDRLGCVVLSEECGCAKPDARIFLRACELGGAAPPDAVYVGDRLDIDADGASRAGLHAVWLNRNGLPAPSPDGAVRTIESLAQLLAVTDVLQRGAG